jgi:UDP-galactopyranose mutase
MIDEIVEIPGARQESSVPYTPIKTKEEKALYANIIARALRESKSMSAT